MTSGSQPTRDRGHTELRSEYPGGQERCRCIHHLSDQRHDRHLQTDRHRRHPDLGYHRPSPSPSAPRATWPSPPSRVTGPTRAAFGTQPTVSVEDAGGNVVTTATNAVTLAIAGPPRQWRHAHLHHQPIGGFGRSECLCRLSASARPGPIHSARLSAGLTRSQLGFVDPLGRPSHPSGLHHSAGRRRQRGNVEHPTGRQRRRQRRQRGHRGD